MTLTDAGADMVRATLPAVIDAFEGFEAALTTDSADRLNVLLRRLCAVLTDDAES